MTGRMNDECPVCEKCGAPITTGSMAVFCPYARECALVEDDDQWENIEDFRKCFGIERAPRPSAQAKALSDPPEVVAAEFDRMVARAAVADQPLNAKPVAYQKPANSSGKA